MESDDHNRCYKIQAAMSNTLRAPDQYMHETIKIVNPLIVDMTI